MPLALLLACLAPASCVPAQMAEPATVRVLVLSLFHSTRLQFCAHAAGTAHLDAEAFALPEGANVTLAGAGERLSLASRGHAANGRSLAISYSSFSLAVPGKLTRNYIGALTVTSTHGVLRAVLTLPTELAVASIVAAEAPPGAAPEALRAQAVAARSFLLANPRRHADADACDTTHCQFLRAPPPAASPASAATRVTSHQVLTWRASPDAAPAVVPAMYARSCGGHTRAHPSAAGAYPFYAVACAYCLRHPELWSRAAPAATPPSEAARLAYNRTHGWSAIPSDTHRQTGVLVEGRGTGHGIGMCQLGAQDLAARGRTYPDILAHYFPNTTLTTLR